MSYYRDHVQSDSLAQTYRRQKALAVQLKTRSADFSGQIESKEANRSYQKMAAILDRPDLMPLFMDSLAECQDQKKAAIAFVKKVLALPLTPQELVDVALRGAAAIMTNGVVTVPLEGLTKAQIVRQGLDSHLRLEFSGPIRAAGGTTIVTLVAIAAYVKEVLKIGDYRPTRDELQRYVIEVDAYVRINPRDIYPSAQEVRLVASSCPVCIDGLATEQDEVPLYKYLPRVSTPRIRGGMALVLVDGLIFRAKKAIQPLKRLGIHWPWLKTLVQMRSRMSREHKGEDKDRQLTLGRPLLSLKGHRGGLRYRLAKSSNNGLSAALLHPLTFELVGFMNIGTQAKTFGNLPKGATLHACADMTPPVVEYQDGVDWYRSGTRDRVLKILDLGQIGYAFGQHLQFSYPLEVRDYCREVWRFKSGLQDAPADAQVLQYHRPGLKLHPDYSLFLTHITPAEFLYIREHLMEGNLPHNSRVKDILRKLCAHCEWKDGVVVLKNPLTFRHHFLLDREISPPLLLELGVLNYVNRVLESGLRIGQKGLNYVNLRIGRAEAVKHSRLKPPINGVAVYRGPKNTPFWSALNYTPSVSYWAGYRRCPGCSLYGTGVQCACGTRTLPAAWCQHCKQGYTAQTLPQLRYGVPPEECHCALGHRLGLTTKTTYSYAQRVREMQRRGYPGMTQPPRITLYPRAPLHSMQPFQKIYLRARQKLPVTKDGLTKLNMMNLATTSFIPSEVRVSLERLRTMGYTQDIHGRPITQESQQIPLKPLDAIYPYESFDQLRRQYDFLDELIQHYYGGPAGYYQIRTPQDLIGVTRTFIAPHTSCAYVSRIVGLARVNGFYRHPVAIAAGRRNMDGDGDGDMALMNTLLNYSRSYASGRNGALMGSPVLLSYTTHLPQVDEEALWIEYGGRFPQYFLDNMRSYTLEQIRNHVPFYRDLGQDLTRTYQYRTPHPVLELATTANLYKDLSTSLEKFEALLHLQDLLLVDNVEYYQGILRGHLIRDCVGNSNAFFRQSYLCSNCKTTYHYPPLRQRCVTCNNGQVRMTVTRRMVTKYLDYINRLAKDPRLSEQVQFKIREVRSNLQCFEQEINPLRRIMSTPLRDQADGSQ